MTKRSQWVPEIAYEEAEDGLTSSIPFIAVPQDEEMPKILFIFESRDTGEIERTVNVNIVIRKAADGSMEVEKVERGEPPAHLAEIAYSDADQVKRLKEDFGLYVVGGGRVNVAGLTKANIGPACEGTLTPLPQ